MVPVHTLTHTAFALCLLTVCICYLDTLMNWEKPCLSTLINAPWWKNHRHWQSQSDCSEIVFCGPLCFPLSFDATKGSWRGHSWRHVLPVPRLTENLQVLQQSSLGIYHHHHFLCLYRFSFWCFGLFLLYRPGRPRTQFISQAGLKFDAILLPQPLKCYNYRVEPPLTFL